VVTSLSTSVTRLKNKVEVLTYRAMLEEEEIVQKNGSTRRAELDKEALFLCNPQQRAALLGVNHK